MLFKILYFFKLIGWKGWVFIALLIALSIWAAKCSRKEPQTPTRTQSTTPPDKLSNEVPADEREQEEYVDSLNTVNP